MKNHITCLLTELVENQPAVVDAKDGALQCVSKQHTFLAQVESVGKFQTPFSISAIRTVILSYELGNFIDFFSPILMNHDRHI